MICKDYKILIVVILIILFSLFLLLPQTQYKIGNIFFGNVPKLYNVNLSQYFFVYAAYPILTKSAPYAHYQLSRTYFIQGKFEMAIHEAHNELKEYPENVRTYYILGLTYGYMNREFEAIEAFSEFIETYPSSWAARNDKAWLQFRIGDIEGALATIEPVKDVQNPWIQNSYGTLLLNSGKNAEAKVAFLKAQELVSNMTEKDWGRAYPGNDPRIYGIGFDAMKISIANNLKLITDNQPVLSPGELGG